MPWATMGALGTEARNCFQTSRMLRGELRVECDAERHALLMEQAADARHAPFDGVLAERLVDQSGSRAVISERKFGPGRAPHST